MKDKNDITYMQDLLPGGTFRVSLDLRFKNYKISAFPGPNVISGGRTEHLPLHFHVFYPKGELRINCSNLEELDNQFVPKDLRKYLSDNKEIILDRAEQIFSTGKLS